MEFLAGIIVGTLGASLLGGGESPRVCPHGATSPRICPKCLGEDEGKSKGKKT